MTLEEIKQNKKVTNADIKFLQEFVYEQGDYKTFEGLRGENITCTGFLAGLIKFVFDIEGILNDDIKLSMYHDDLSRKNSVSKFDRAKNLISKLNRNAYMTLID